MKGTHTVYFICPTNRLASGGVKQIYRHAEALNKAGYHAIILHRKIGRAERWFKSDVVIKYSPYFFKKMKYGYKRRSPGLIKQLYLKFLKFISHRIDKNSILVIPEIYGPYFHQVEPDNKIVIFNQNCYYTFSNYSLEVDNKESPYTAKNTLATIIGSDDAKQYLQYVFPNISIYKMTLGIDSQLFFYAKEKIKQICYMPRKLSEDVTQVIQILKLHGLPPEWSLVAIEDKNEAEVAEIMKASIFFLSFSHREGFGLPPVEAMACGCYVIGYEGRGGKEYFDPAFSVSIAEGDIIEYAKQVQLAVAEYDKNPAEIVRKGALASTAVRSRYSLENEYEDTISIWKKIFTELKKPK